MLAITNRFCTAFAVGVLLLGATSVRAQDQVLPRVLESCKGEISEFCARITPGGGRVVACLYAHQGSLSGHCDYVLFDAAAELQNFIGEMERIARVCKPDIEVLCSKVASGEGRVLQCLKLKQKALSAPCHDAIEETGIEVQ